MDHDPNPQMPPISGSQAELSEKLITLVGRSFVYEIQCDTQFPKIPMKDSQREDEITKSTNPNEMSYQREHEIANSYLRKKRILARTRAGM